MIGSDHPDTEDWADQDGVYRKGIDTAPEPPDEAVSVVAFPVLHPDALHGLPGKIIDAIGPHTEAHPAALLLQFLAVFGVTIGAGPHLRIDNRPHPARIFPLIVGKTSDGAKGTSYGAVAALFAAAEDGRRGAWLGGSPLRQVSGLSSGEGLIELVRDPNGDDPDSKGFDEGQADKRLLVVEEEFAGVLAVMERTGNTLPRVLREAWDGNRLQTLTRSPLVATGAHITLIAQCTPGELRIRLSEAAMLGGTMNRLLPTASRRTKLLPEGGNIPSAVLEEYGPQLAEAVAEAAAVREVARTTDAVELWHSAYPDLRRARPDGPVATILARAAPQVLRLALAYALADRSTVIDRPHLVAALAIWRYVEQTAEWMFGAHLDDEAVDKLLEFVTAGGSAGRTRTEISKDHFGGNKKKEEIAMRLAELMKDGRIREEKDSSKPGRPTFRYFTSTN